MPVTPGQHYDVTGFVMPPITEVQRLTLRPGDRLVMRCTVSKLSDQDAATIRDRVRAALQAPDLPIMLIDEEWHVWVSDGPAPDEGGQADLPRETCNDMLPHPRHVWMTLAADQHRALCLGRVVNDSPGRILRDMSEHG